MVDWFWILVDFFDYYWLVDILFVLMVGEESVFEGCLVDVVCYCVDLDVCGGLMF